MKSVGGLAKKYRMLVVLALLLLVLVQRTHAEAEATVLLVDASIGASPGALQKARAALKEALTPLSDQAVVGLRWSGPGVETVLVPQPFGKGAILGKLAGLQGTAERDLAAGLRGAATDFGPYREHPTLLLVTGGAGRSPEGDLTEAKHLAQVLPKLKCFLAGVDLDDAGKSELQQLGTIFRTNLDVTSLDSLGNTLSGLAPFNWSEPGAPVTPGTPPSMAPPEVSRVESASPFPPAEPRHAPPGLPAPAPGFSLPLVLGVVSALVMVCLQAPGEIPRRTLYLACAGMLAGSVAEGLRTAGTTAPAAVLAREAVTFLIAGAILGFAHGASGGIGSSWLTSWRAGIRSGMVGAVGALGGALSPAVLVAFGKGSGTWSWNLLGQCSAWCVLGACVGAGPGLTERQIATIGRGLAGGILGGFCGGASYVFLGGILADGPARTVALALMGAIIGLAVRARGPAGATASPVRPAFPAGALARLVSIPAGPSAFLTKEEVVLGNQADSILPMGTDPVHALLKRAKSGEWFIFDKSTTGTRVNGTRITQRTRLEHGATIGAGNVEVRFELPE